jgi:hypothetical protein
MSDTIGGWNFFTEDYKAMLESPRYVEQGSVTKQLFSNDAARILELNSKSGLYPLYLAYSLFRERCEKLKAQKVELTRETQQAVWRDVVKENIFVVCKTPMAKTITRRTLLGYYPEEAGDCNLEYFHNLIPVLRNNPDKFVRNVLNPSTWNKKGLSTMKFEAIVGNPPYQVMDGSGGADDSAVPVYHKFVEMSCKIMPNFFTLIMPSKWMTGGRGLDAFRANFSKDTHICKFYDYANARECFDNIHIDGGISYFLWDQFHDGPTDYIYKSEDNVISKSSRFLYTSFSSFVIRDGRIINLLERTSVGERFSNIISSTRPYGIRGYLFNNPERYPDANLQTKPFVNSCKIYGVKGLKGGARRQEGYINVTSVTRMMDEIQKFKLFFTTSYSTGAINFPEIIKGMPGEVCTETFLRVGPFETQVEQNNCFDYMHTKFFKILLYYGKGTMHVTKDVFQFIPLQDFSKPWTDEELYKKYELTEEEIAFIESMIKPMA